MTLMLIPGFMLDADLWGDVAPALAPVGPLIAADLSQGDSLPDMAARLLAQAPARVSVLGFSMGGYVARQMVRMAPERIERLVLVATSARPDPPERRRQLDLAAGIAARGPFHGVSRGSIARGLHPARAGDAALIERVRAMGERMGRDAFLRQLRLQRPEEHDLGAIACPTLVIAAAQDPLRSLEEAAELSRAIPGARLEVIEECGHMVPLEQPQALAALVVPWLRAAPG